MISVFCFGLVIIFFFIGFVLDFLGGFFDLCFFLVLYILLFKVLVKVWLVKVLMGVVVEVLRMLLSVVMVDLFLILILGRWVEGSLKKVFVWSCGGKLFNIVVWDLWLLVKC